MVVDTGAHKLHSESYYYRHRSERREYQRCYSATKRTGRRKLSKHDRLVNELNMRDQLEGRRLVYINSIVCRDRTSDPERTSAMVAAEEALKVKCLFLESDAVETMGDAWIPSYISSLQSLLDDQLATASTCPESSDVSRNIHTQCRLIALLYQEIQLISQGVRIRAQAVEDRALVSMGRRLNRVVFFREFKLKF